MMPKISTNSASYRCSAFRAALGCRPCMATPGILWNHMEALQLWDSSEVVFRMFSWTGSFKMYQALLASKSRGMLWWPSRHCASAFMAPGCRKGLSIEHQRQLLELANSQHLETCWDCCGNRIVIPEIWMVGTLSWFITFHHQGVHPIVSQLLYCNVTRVG